MYISNSWFVEDGETQAFYGQTQNAYLLHKIYDCSQALSPNSLILVVGNRLSLGDASILECESGDWRKRWLHIKPKEKDM